MPGPRSARDIWSERRGVEDLIDRPAYQGMVSDRAEGTRRRYRLNEHGVAALRDQLDTFWRRTLEGLEENMKEEQR